MRAQLNLHRLDRSVYHSATIRPATTARTLAFRAGLSRDHAELALTLAREIIAAQNEAIAAQCTCGGLLHHRATCPAVALCAGCAHEG